MGKIAVDIIIYNGYVITMDSAQSRYPHGAIAIRGNSIVDVGVSTHICSIYQGSEMIDAVGDLILPGFINGHSHSAMSLLRGIADCHSLHSWLHKSIFPIEEKIVDKEFVYWGTKLALVEMMRAGITTVVDMYWHPECVAQACEELGMRAHVGANITGDEQDLAEASLFIDRWCTHETITPAIAPHSIMVVPHELLLASQLVAHKKNVPLLMHVAETEQEVNEVLERYGMRPILFLAENGMLTSRLVIAHGVHLSELEIERVAQAQVGVIHCPISNLKLASGIAPLLELLEKGCAVGLGSDGAASNNSLTILGEMKCAALLSRVATKNTHLVTTEDIVAIATSRGAQAIHRADQLGSLEVGKYADIISIRLDEFHQIPVYDPLSTLVFASRASDVRTVIIHGKIQLRNGAFTAPFKLFEEIREHTRYYQERVMPLLHHT